MSYAPILTELTEPPPAPRKNLTEKPVVLPKQKLLKSRLWAGRPKQQTGCLEANAAQDYPIIVHSHLRWDWVWQRPQQFVSRLSRRHRILFVETLPPDPQLAAPLAGFRALEGFPNITVLSLQFPAWRWSDGKYVDAERLRLVSEFAQGPAQGQFQNAVQWFYDPMAAPIFLDRMGERLNVYDCMDELSKFHGAPPEIVERERQLLARADVVFTGGRKLFEAKSRLHANCHFHGCGVDREHFGRALDSTLDTAGEIAALPGPVFGYFGVVDERLDYELLSVLAEANPRASVVMVGPVLKVEEQTLPRRTNLHWLGQRAYADLPALCKGFDVCLMPFALNEATQYINPTKALEYMAAGRPIVSTAVPDVVANFGSVVQIAHTQKEFVSLCQRAASRADRAAIARGISFARQNSWDSIVAQLEQHVAEALQPARGRT